MTKKGLRKLDDCSTGGTFLLLHHQTADDAERKETDSQTYPTARVVLHYHSNLASRAHRLSHNHYGLLLGMTILLLLLSILRRWLPILLLGLMLHLNMLLMLLVRHVVRCISTCCRCYSNYTCYGCLLMLLSLVNYTTVVTTLL